MTLPCLRKSLRSPVAKTSAAEGLEPLMLRKAIDPASFHVYGGEQGCGYAGLAVFQEVVGLLSAGNVAGEQDDAGGLNAGQQISQAGRHFGAVETDDEQLSDAAMKVGGGCVWALSAIIQATLYLDFFASFALLLRPLR